MEADRDPAAQEVGRAGSRTADPVLSVTRGWERGLEPTFCATSGAGGGSEEGSSSLMDFGFIRQC